MDAFAVFLVKEASSIMASALLNVTETFVTSSDGAQIFVQAVGNPQLPPLVFVHGFALSALVWASVMQSASLLQYFHLIAYDVRGHGRSAKPDPIEAYSSRFFADDFMAAARAFNTAHKPLLVGWSMGSTVASDVFEHHGPDALAGVVFVGGLPLFEHQVGLGTPLALGLLPGFMNLDDTALGITTRIEFTNACFNNPENVPAQFLWSMYGSTLLTGPVKTVNVVGGRNQNSTNFWAAGENGMPLLVLDGSADKLINVDATYALVNGRFTDLTRHTTPGGSHTFFYEDESVFIDNILAFGRRVFGV